MNWVLATLHEGLLEISLKVYLSDTFFYKYQQVFLTITVQNCNVILSDKFSTLQYNTTIE